MNNSAITELEFCMQSEEGMDQFTAIYDEIVFHARRTGDYSLLRQARALLIKQVQYLAGQYIENMPDELRDYAQSSGMLGGEVQEN